MSSDGSSGDERADGARRRAAAAEPAPDLQDLLSKAAELKTAQARVVACVCVAESARGAHVTPARLRNSLQLREKRRVFEAAPEFLQHTLVRATWSACSVSLL